MQALSGLLADATAAIEPGYFQLSIHGGSPAYRERVYCYELYHRMRLLWPDGCGFTLNGEVDKTNHPVLTQLGAAGFKPDLLVHRPGEMAGNHAVIEVKSARGMRHGLRKDLRTLQVFRQLVGYERAIYLVYGDEARDDLVDRILNRAAGMELTVPIELWLHSSPGDAAIHACTIEGGPVAKSRQSEFSAGDRVFHQKFGYGCVELVDGNTLTIAFEKAGERRVVDSFVDRA